jgi:putative ABC transport system permease protein
MLIFVAVILGLVGVAFVTLIPVFIVFLLGEFVLKRVPSFAPLRFILIVIKNLRRNLLRTCLTYVATYVLVMIVTGLWSVLYFVDFWATEKSKDLKVIVSEKWQADTHLPFSYAAPLAEGAASRPSDIHPLDSMTWQMYVGTIDPAKKTFESYVIFFALEPKKILTMLDEIFDDLLPSKKNRGQPSEKLTQMQELIQKLESNKRGALVGPNRMLLLNKKVGERFVLTGISHKDLDLEFEILGELPRTGKYDDLAFMNRDYLLDALDNYPRTHGGTKHDRADRSLDMIWLKVADRKSYERIAEQIDSSGLFQTPPVKCETFSSALGSVKEVYGDMLWALRWLLSPAIIATMTMVLANAIGISVRERRMEIAVLKVLGFRPAQILMLILGEAVLLGAVSGFVCTGLTYLLINIVLGSVQALFITVPDAVLWWGPALGGLSALAGSVFPAWSACRVNVSDVFARVA